MAGSPGEAASATTAGEDPNRRDRVITAVAVNIAFGVPESVSVPVHFFPSARTWVGLRG